MELVYIMVLIERDYRWKSLIAVELNVVFFTLNQGLVNFARDELAFSVVFMLSV